MSLNGKFWVISALACGVVMLSAGNIGASIKGNGTAKLDQLLFAALKEKGTPLSERCPDEVFVRRVFLDVIGTLPSATEVRQFLSDTATDKRAKLIDSLLNRDEFSAYWGLKWGDLLRIKAEFPSNLWPNAVQAYDRWVRESIRENKPYDRFVRELLTGSGSNFRNPCANFYRAFQDRSPRQIADNVALVFMGLRLKSSGWSEEQIQGFSAFFAKIGYKNTDEWKEEIVFFNPDGKLIDPATKKPVWPCTPDGKVFKLPPDQDPRVAFANWLTAPRNPWFARCIANRVWYWLMGRGLVHEPDDMRPDNPAWSPAVLKYLEGELTSHHYDLKHLYRLILNSEVYQASSIPNDANASDETGFSHYRIRRIDAEPLLDAINQITGTGEKYTSAIPEPFTFLPDDQRAIQLADGSIDLPFLEMFGRPTRNTSYESDRNSQPSVFQAQHLLNSSHIQKKIDQSPTLRQVAAGRALPQKIKEQPPVKLPGKGKGKGGDQVVGGVKRPFVVQPADNNPRVIEELYLRILSRFPTDQEKATADEYLKSSKRTPADSVCDLAWALVNTSEFILKH